MYLVPDKKLKLLGIVNDTPQYKEKKMTSTAGETVQKMKGGKISYEVKKIVKNPLTKLKHAC